MTSSTNSQEPTINDHFINENEYDDEDEAYYGPTSFGPSPPPSHQQHSSTATTTTPKAIPFTELRAHEQYALIRGKMTYFEVLYAKYTPCGDLYDQLKPHILTKAQAKKLKRPQLDPNSLLVKQFKQCLYQNMAFYERRQQNLDDFKRSTAF